MMMLEKLKKWFIAPEKRGTDTETDAALSAVLTGNIFYSGILKDEALNIPAVSASIEFIAGTVAGLPIKLYKQTGDTIQEIEDDYRLKLLNDETGDLLDAAQCKKAIIKDMLLNGAGYAYVEHKSNKITGIYYVDDSYVNVIDSVDPIKKAVKIYLNGTEYRDFEVFRLTKDSKNGITGRGILQNNPVLLSAMYNALKYENTAVSSGTKRGFLKSKYKLDSDMLESLKQAWRKLYSTDVNNSPDVIVLNEGISFEPANSTATENQLNESKKTNSQLVYQLFGLSDGLFDTTSGSQDAYINNIKTGIIPIVDAMNVAINKFFLLEKEKGSYFFELDTSSILRSSISERYAAYNTALTGGWLQVDEVRKAENLPPLGLDFVKLNLGDIMYYPKDGTVYTPNTNSISGMDSKQIGGDQDKLSDE